jgi:intron-binding protein aquarius
VSFKTSQNCLQVCQFQRLLFKYWPQLRDLALSNCAAACAPEGLKRALAGLRDDELQQLVCRQLRLTGEDDPWAQVRGKLHRRWCQ